MRVEVGTPGEGEEVLVAALDVPWVHWHVTTRLSRTAGRNVSAEREKVGIAWSEAEAERMIDEAGVGAGRHAEARRCVERGHGGPCPDSEVGRIVSELGDGSPVEFDPRWDEDDMLARVSREVPRVHVAEWTVFDGTLLMG